MVESQDVEQNGLPRILVCDPLHADGIALLREHAQVDTVDGPGLSPEELTERVGPYNALINRSRTSIPESVIRRGTQLQVIGRAGVGLDNIDTAVAEELGIAVVNCPDANTVAVAEHTLGLLLGLARHIAKADQSMKNGRWEKSSFLGTGLAGKTLGLIGFGRIGREVAIRAKAFDMKILVNQNRLTPELASEWRVENVDFPELLAQSDFISIHVPMRAANVNLIDAKELAMMKPTAFLLNTSRGGIINEDALLDALNNQEIAGAALDVFMGEPKVRSDLVTHPNVLATPHIAASTESAQRVAALTVAEQVLASFKSKSSANVLSLRVVPVDNVLPHEEYHGPRVERLSAQLQADGTLVNPPLVAEIDNGKKYVVLDGATRTTAFKHLQYPHVVVQVIDMKRDNVQLHAWSHVVRNTAGQQGSIDFLSLVRNVVGLRLVETSIENLDDSIHQKNVLGYMLSMEGIGYRLELDQELLSKERDWLDVMNDLVYQYGEWGDVERTLLRDLDDLSTIYKDMAALVVFPAFTPDTVMRVAEQGRLLPAGITRFIIPGRILRLNAPLKEMMSDGPLSAKTEWLDKFVSERLSKRQIRYYEEPVVILDE